ncbi:MAG: 3-hydroxyacyl-CoA dehydrogenase NAD-binding domain-containing protein [Phycisphaerales bacterium]|nr:3-hydroxyacyl-CoA dehydrogenase NAD-binding domain-containing protein [Phycisphaerales bacterium]
MTSNTTLGILGAGAMGSGIAQVAATHGWSVRLLDREPDIVSRALDQVAKRLDRQVEKGRLDRSAADEAAQRLHPATSPTDFQDCAVVLEAVVEDLDAKVAAMAPLIEAVSPTTIIATNTSSLSVTELGERLGTPERTCGMHFFNPAPIMRLVEIIRGRETDQEVVDRAAEIAAGWGKHVARAADTPGFIVNRVARPYYLEAFRCLEDGLATPEIIDGTMKQLGGFRMGPLELTDFIGHDVNTATTRTVWTQWDKPSRLMPSLAQEQLVAEGQLGRKSGQGVYDYSGETPVAIVRPGHDAATIAAGDLKAITAFISQASIETENPVQQVILARILCAIFNEALWARHDGVAEPDDIDIAMQFGVNYPHGPFNWMTTIGEDVVLNTMQALERMSGTGRFTPPAGS